MTATQETAKVTVAEFVEVLKRELMSYAWEGDKISPADQISCFNDVLRINFRLSSAANLPKSLQKFFLNDMQNKNEYATIVGRLERLVRLERQGAR